MCNGVGLVMVVEVTPAGGGETPAVCERFLLPGAQTDSPERRAPSRPCGEIGRHKGLKIPRRKASRFKSGQGHQGDLT